LLKKKGFSARQLNKEGSQTLLKIRSLERREYTSTRMIVSERQDLLDTEDALRKLMKKLKKQQDHVDPSDTYIAHMKAELDDILFSHDIEPSKNSKFIEDLMLWRKNI